MRHVTGGRRMVEGCGGLGGGRQQVGWRVEVYTGCYEGFGWYGSVGDVPIYNLVQEKGLAGKIFW